MAGGGYLLGTMRNAIFPNDRHALYEQHGYSPAVRSGDLLFVSGQVGARDDGSPEPDLIAQTHLAFDNLDRVLEAAGCTFDDVQDVTLFIVDPAEHLEALLPVVRARLGDAPHPTLTGVGVTWLSGFQIEVKVIARVPAR